MTYKIFFIKLTIHNFLIKKSLKFFLKLEQNKQVLR